MNPDNKESVSIIARVYKVVRDLPQDVSLVGAVKSRSSDEIKYAIAGGLRIIGYNYVQEAKVQRHLFADVEWHFIGHLQRNKVRTAVQLFDLIQTVDSLELASFISSEACRLDKHMPILIEVNVGREKQKSGVWPERAEEMVKVIAQLPSIQIEGLMTMGPNLPSGQLRPYFAEAKKLFDHIGSLNITGVRMRYLSMGMSDSYLVAIEEGANMVRIGRLLFEEA